MNPPSKLRYSLLQLVFERGHHILFHCAVDTYGIIMQRQRKLCGVRVPRKASHPPITPERTNKMIFFNLRIAIVAVNQCYLFH